ncbi:unnamed protein product [Leptidea sinapis]|uniref:Uncharacterized protein n=1 Tax=Leptidea sinapis TaxID=189913 RepID=A0A5E4QQ75_9NEOP|nr:unnamed protein product [Leptidea sinapis]
MIFRWGDIMRIRSVSLYLTTRRLYRVYLAKKKKKDKKKHKHKHKHKHNKDKKDHKDKLSLPPSTTDHLRIKEETRETLSSILMSIYYCYSEQFNLIC